MIALLIILVIIVIVVFVVRGQKNLALVDNTTSECSIDPSSKSDIEYCSPYDLTTPNGVKKCCLNKKGGDHPNCYYCRNSSVQPEKAGMCMTDEEYQKYACN